MVVKKIIHLESAQKIHASIGVNVKCSTPTLVGMAFPVLELKLAFKLGQISLLDHGL